MTASTCFANVAGVQFTVKPFGDRLKIKCVQQLTTGRIAEISRQLIAPWARDPRHPNAVPRRAPLERSFL